MLAEALAHDLGLPAPELSIAQVHPEQIAGEQGGLVSAGAGPNLQIHVAGVGRVCRKQQDLELALEARSPTLSRIDLFLRELAHVGVGAGEDLTRLLYRVHRRVVLHEALDDRAQLGMLLGERSEPGRIGGDLRLGEQCADLGVALAQPFELFHQGRIHRTLSSSGPRD